MDINWNEIILSQLILARQGESCRSKWWNVDATDGLGGYSIMEQFFPGKDIRKNIYRRLITGEATLEAASLFEKSLFLERSQKKIKKLRVFLFKGRCKYEFSTFNR